MTFWSLLLDTVENDFSLQHSTLVETSSTVESSKVKSMGTIIVVDMSMSVRFRRDLRRRSTDDGLQCFNILSALFHVTLSSIVCVALIWLCKNCIKIQFLSSLHGPFIWFCEKCIFSQFFSSLHSPSNELFLEAMSLAVAGKKNEKEKC